MTTAFDARRVIVIGAGPGLGAAIARRFARERYQVTLVARDPASLCRELRDQGVDAVPVIADAGDPHAFARILKDLAATVAPRVVVYNAAVVATDDMLTDDIDYLVNTYAVNVLGAVTAAQVFTPAMRRDGAGTFLATSGRPGSAQASLSVGKAGLRAAIAAMHDELKADGVHATTVTVAGAIVPGTALDPGAIAETYWSLHRQPATEWTAEVTVTGGETPL